MNPETQTTVARTRAKPLAGIRVAVFTGAYNHIADGVSLTLNRLVKHTMGAGANVKVFAPTAEQPALEHEGALTPVPSIAMPGRDEYRISLGLGTSAARELEAFNPHLIHVATPDLLGRSGLKFARENGIPVLATYHTHFTSYLDYYNLGFAENAVWKYLKEFYDDCDAVYAPTPPMADILREHGIEGNVDIWPRGVETDRFTPTKRSMEWRRKMGFADDEFVVAFISRLVWEKGLGTYARVIERLEDHYPVRPLIVGEGPACAELRRRLPDAVFTGHLKGDDLPTAYASSDVFLFPSETETFGNVTLEAMASGLPAVCADAVGSNALVQHGSTGFLVPPKDDAAFSERVVQLITDAPLRRNMSAAAREHALTYSWPLILDQMVRNYCAALEGSGDGLATASLPQLASPR